MLLTIGVKMPCDPIEFLVLGRRRGNSGVHEGILSRKSVYAYLHVA